MIPLRDDVPCRTTPFITWALIAACSLAYLWQMSLGKRGFEVVVYNLGVIPATLLGDIRLPSELYVVPPLVTIFTSMFLHGSLMHLFGNMLYLWIFGNNVEDAMGHLRFLVFYLLTGTMAALVQSAANISSAIPMVGASGAISGVLGAYLLLHPRAHVLVFIPLGFFSQLVHLPAMLVLGLWFVLQLVSSALADQATGGVAFGAHIGGFIAGMALIPLFKRRQVRLPAR
ncbi:MAG: rhomboid family intramembrane serine protease [Gammaproteobacteria bacterium]|nr:rhomboid family intramembrane serine protease [Gammaproteobacteria bacterium]